MSHEALHESTAELKPATLDMHRAIVSLIELKDYLFTSEPIAHE